MIGSNVEIRSTGGICYRGVVRAIREAASGGEIFELGSDDDPLYCRYVLVVDRDEQIAELADD